MSSTRRLITQVVLDDSARVERADHRIDGVRRHPASEGGVGRSARDADLLNSMARGERASLIAVYERHHACVHQMAGRLYGRGRSSGVTREVFAELWSAPGVVDTTGSSLCTALLIATLGRGIVPGPAEGA